MGEKMHASLSRVEGADRWPANPVGDNLSTKAGNLASQAGYREKRGTGKEKKIPEKGGIRNEESTHC